MLCAALFCISITTPALATSGSASTSLLSPPDTTSPRATFDSFRRLTDQIAEQYAAYRESPSAQSQQTFLRAVDQGKQLMDLSNVPPTAQHEIATA
ncbi:hypothetical protein U5801_29470, partial [Lamprobacter modestohalophilus]|uniref:hypothetical protein n=1 Tax=Lamprobacter modestohalophilus TaxID=1064514 RepID=UPI002ADEAD5C